MRTKNKQKQEFILILLIGIAIFAVAFTFLMAMYRPFVPWVEMQFSKDYSKSGASGTYYIDEVGNDAIKSKVHYFYEIDGVKYEKTYSLSVSTHSSGTTGAKNIIYVNRNNPTKTKPGSQGGIGLLILLSLSMAGGIFTSYFAFSNYKRKLKK